MASWWQVVVPGGWCRVKRSHKLRVPRHGLSLVTQTPNWTLIESHCIDRVLWDTGPACGPFLWGVHPACAQSCGPAAVGLMEPGCGWPAGCPEPSGAGLGCWAVTPLALLVSL